MKQYLRISALAFMMVLSVTFLFSSNIPASLAAVVKPNMDRILDVKVILPSPAEVKAVRIVNSRMPNPQAFMAMTGSGSKSLSGLSAFMCTNVQNTNTGEFFCTIQAAIDDSDTQSGHTIVVSAGTYNENITIPDGKNGLVIQGPNTGLNDAKGTRASEASIVAVSNAPVITVSSNVSSYTIDGFRIVGIDYNDASNGRMIHASGTSTVHNILNNLFELNSNDATTAKRYIWLGPASSFNQSGGPSIQGNIKYNHFTNSGSGDQFMGLIVQATQTNFEVSHNWFEGLKGQRNVHINHPSTTTVVRYNDLENVGGTRPVIYLGGAGSIASGATPGAVFENNNFISSVGGFQLESNTNFPVTITNNSFGGITGSAYYVQILPGSTASVTAACNWWGSGDPAVLATTLPTKISGNVYVPSYLDAGTDASANVGFQPGGTCKDAPVRVYSDLAETNLVRAYFTIQPAISNGTTLSGHVVRVDAGTYAGNLTVNKSLNIRGPNYNISPNTGMRVAEAIITPPSSSTTTNLVTVTTSNVVINGFTIDGDNTGLPASGQGLSGSTDAPRGVYLSTNGADGLKVQNNILKNFLFAGVRIEQITNWFPTNASATFSSFHLIHDNLIEDIGDNAGSGQGVDLRQSAYAAVTNNVVDNAFTGILLSSFRITHDGGTTYQNISGNTLRTRKYGIWFNLYRAEPYAVSSNTIEAVSDALTTEWFGVMMASVAMPQNFLDQVKLPKVMPAVKWTYSNNAIDGANMHASTTGFGYWLWNVDNNRDGDGTIGTDHYGTISGGTVSNVHTGIYMSNVVNPYPTWGTGTTGAHASVSNVSFSLNAGGTGIFMKDDAAWSSSSIAPLVAKRNVIMTPGAGLGFTGGAKGIVFDFPDPSTMGFVAYDALTGATINTLTFSGQTGNYIEMLKYNRNLAATGATFDGLLPSAMTLTQLYDLEDKIVHGIDVGTLGFVTVNTAKAYVTPSSFAAPTTTTASVQRAIGALADPGTVHIESGDYSANTLDATGKNITFAPGSSPACVMVGDFTLNSGDALDMEANSVTPCTGYDQIAVTGTVTLGGATLNLSLGYMPLPGDSHTLISNDSNDPVSGQFAQGSTIFVGMNEYRINYTGGDGNDVVIYRCGILNVNTNTVYCTGAEALAAALPGEIIEFPAGTYSESLMITQPQTIRTAGGPVTIQQVTLNGTGSLLTLNSDFEFDQLILTNGLIHTNGNNLKCGTTTGGSPSSYVVTD